MRELDLRCFCSARPLLGVCGRDTQSGDLYVHIKVFKGGHVHGEVVATGGIVRVRCRSCSRWHVVTIWPTKVDFEEQPLPVSIQI